MGDHWPWEARELDPKLSFNESAFPQHRTGIWLLKTSIIGNYCISCHGKQFSTLVGDLTFLGQKFYNDTAQETQWWMLGKCHTLHTKEAHERYLTSKSLISRLAGWLRKKMVQQLLSASLALSSIWEKARARDRQREVAGDKGQWGFVLQGVRPAAAQAAEWWQGAVLIIPPFFV
jgi:hypothetical protein